MEPQAIPRRRYRCYAVPVRSGGLQRQEGDAPEENHYEVAMKSYLARKPRKINWPDGRRLTREELHDRAGQR